MEVILLEKIRNLGGLGDKVKVKPGYGRNYLLPKRKAASATAVNLAKFEAHRAELEKRAAEMLTAAQQRVEELSALPMVTIPAKVAEEGKLYGSVTVTEIAKAITQAGVKVNKSEIQLPGGPIRLIGEYEIQLLLHSDVLMPLKISVIAE